MACTYLPLSLILGNKTRYFFINTPSASKIFEIFLSAFGLVWLTIHLFTPDRAFPDHPPFSFVFYRKLLNSFHINNSLIPEPWVKDWEALFSLAGLCDSEDLGDAVTWDQFFDLTWQLAGVLPVILLAFRLWLICNYWTGIYEAANYYLWYALWSWFWRDSPDVTMMNAETSGDR